MHRGRHQHLLLLVLLLLMLLRMVATGLREQLHGLCMCR
jgi:hypothetical protein